MNHTNLPLEYGSVAWKFRDILDRHHSAATCPHQGNCLNEEQAIEALLSITQQERVEARIDELEKLQPPEQYAEYAKLMGSEVCTICGFNAMKFRRHISERIATLQDKKS